MNSKGCPVPNFERLLLSTDGSEFSKAAISEAIEIAKACSSKLYVLSVIEVNPEYESLAPEAVEKAEIKTRKHIESVRLKASREGIECETIIHRGEEPYEYIISEALRRKVNIIIMGSHGRTGLKRLMMGSTTSRVIGHAPCQVLVVPLKTKR